MRGVVSRAEVGGGRGEPQPPVLVPQLWQSLHEELPPEGAHTDPHGRETVLVLVVRMRGHVLAIGRADEAHEETQRSKTFPLQSLQQELR